VVGTHLSPNFEILIFFGFLNFFPEKMEKKKWKKKNGKKIKMLNIVYIEVYPV